MAANCVSVLITPGWAPVASCVSGWRGGGVSKFSMWVWQPPFKWLPLCWDVGCMRLFMHHWRGESASYSLLVLLYARSAGLQSQIFSGIIFPVQESRLGNPVWGCDSLLLGENLWSCEYPPVCGSLTLNMGFGFIVSTPPTHLWFLLSIFSCGKSFSASLQVILVDSFSVRSCNACVSIDHELRIFLLCHLGQNSRVFLK